jgi:hypothetical protein
MKYPTSPMPKQSSCPTNERFVFSQNLAIANKPANGINKAEKAYVAHFMARTGLVHDFL